MTERRIPRLLARAIAAVAMGGVLALGAGLLTATPAAAVPATGHSAPVSKAQRVDQCGSKGTEWVPDRGPTFDFRGPCRRHDICYGSHPYGSSSAGRKACDDDFRRDALKSCAAHNRVGPSMAVCANIANDYYWVLRAVGDDAFQRGKPKSKPKDKPKEKPKNPSVTVRPLEPIHPEGRGGRSSAPRGGGSGPIGGSPAPNPSVTVREAEVMDK